MCHVDCGEMVIMTKNSETEWQNTNIREGVLWVVSDPYFSEENNTKLFLCQQIPIFMFSFLQCGSISGVSDTPSSRCL